VILRQSPTLDALRKAKLPGTLRDFAILWAGASIASFSSILPSLQEIIMLAAGSPLMAYGGIMLVKRSLRSYRSGNEL